MEQELKAISQRNQADQQLETRATYIFGGQLAAKSTGLLGAQISGQVPVTNERITCTEAPRLAILRGRATGEGRSTSS
jgi:hypothetical protein